MSRFGSLAAVLTGSAAYVVAVLVISATVLLRRVRETRTGQSGGDFLDGFLVPAWWWVLLILPPLVLIAWWLFRSRDKKERR
jgi:uncharacterized membrane protein YhaH (DUF805 family)